MKKFLGWTAREWEIATYWSLAVMAADGLYLLDFEMREKTKIFSTCFENQDTCDWRRFPGLPLE